MESIMNKQIIAVVGATGAQGGGLARAMLSEASAEFSVRAITRRPDGAKAVRLRELGAEIAVADLDDAASLRRAFEGADGVFCVTNFWEHGSADRELVQARNLANAARACKVSHVVWSTLEDTRESAASAGLPTLEGRYKVPHFDAKGEADRSFADLPTTYLLAAFYWENFIHFGLGPKPDASGELSLTLPLGGAKLPGVAAEDIGRSALGVFRNGKYEVGRRIPACGDQLTGPEMCDALSRALQRRVRYHEIAPAAFRALGFPGADDLGNMFEYQAASETEFCAARSPALTRRLHSDVLNFASWLRSNKTALLPSERAA
jgi:uncharacterized protein YbjT (DUF2867 family)